MILNVKKTIEKLLKWLIVINSWYFSCLKAKHDIQNNAMAAIYLLSLIFCQKQYARFYCYVKLAMTNSHSHSLIIMSKAKVHLKETSQFAVKLFLTRLIIKHVEEDHFRLD